MQHGGHITKDLLGPRGVPVGGGGAANYEQRLVADYGATEVWPLVDILSGTAIHAFVNSARNGTLTAWDLQNAAGPVTADARKAPYSDGVNDSGSIYSANLAAAFSGNEASVLIWAKMYNAGVWGDGTGRTACIFRVDTSNLIMLSKRVNANELRWEVVSGGTSRNLNIGSLSSTAWMCMAITHSRSANQTRMYLNGAEIAGSPLASGADWAGSLDSTRTVIGSSTVLPSSSWNGWLAYCTIKIGAPVWTPTQIAEIYALANP